MEHARKRIHRLLDPEDASSGTSRTVSLFLAAVILLNIVFTIAETEAELAAKYSSLFFWVELVSVVIFASEYLLRLWTITADRFYSAPVTGRLRYAAKPMMVLDCVVLVAAFMPLLGLDLRMLRAARLVRLLRILRLGRYSRSLRLLIDVLRSRAPDLLAATILLGVLWVFASTLLYYAEKTAQPDLFSSIPKAMWWGIVTLTTIGYGEFYPVTFAGKLCVAVFAVSSVLTFAIPTGIVSAGFKDALSKAEE